MLDSLKAGAENCALDCAEIQKNWRVYVVNEEGAVDPEIVEAITEVASSEGANVRVVWGSKIPKTRPGDIPHEVLDAFREADVLISHYPSLQRESLHVHFPGETRTRVPNRADKGYLLESGWARFPYSLQRNLSSALDNIMQPGAAWRITSPNGTDLKGVFADAPSTVGQAYFAAGDENSRARRNFPGGVHSPHNSNGVEGVVVVDYLDHQPEVGTSEALRIELKENRIVAITGGGHAEAIRKILAEKTDGFLDSWHAGVNPKTIAGISREENPRAWFSYVHCSPKLLHLHLGRSHAPVNVGVFNQSISVNGQDIYRHGELLEFEDAALQAAMQRAGRSFQSLRTEGNLFSISN